MGVKHFFVWFKKKYREHVHPVYVGAQTVPAQIDALLLDMNGIYHSAAQKVYKYGAGAPSLLEKKLQGSSLFPGGKPPPLIVLYRAICQEVLDLILLTRPRKKLVMCVDGPAPLSKQNQQRQRRFRGAYGGEGKPNGFDTSQITPGTEMMYQLTKYIDWFLRSQLNSRKEPWASLDIIFSCERVPGEGEQKIMQYVRTYGDPEDSYCIYGMDADLIMLAMLSRMEHFYVLREDVFEPTIQYHLIDVEQVRRQLSERDLRWSCTTQQPSADSTYDRRRAVDDFVLICFLVGNDFLPQIPVMEIFQGGLDLLVEIYTSICPGVGHLTRTSRRGLSIRMEALARFLEVCARYEKENLEYKLKKSFLFFPDPLLQAAKVKPSTPTIDHARWSSLYLKKKFPAGTGQREICDLYLKGMEWVLQYYTWGVSDWYWSYPFNYAPPMSWLGRYAPAYAALRRVGGDPLDVAAECAIPTSPFLQLLCVLPPASSYLLPKPLDTLLTSPTSPLRPYCPEVLTIDLGGKRKEWEGIVILPALDFPLFKEVYLRHIDQVSLKNRLRNSFSFTVRYVYTPRGAPIQYKSPYGNIPNCRAKIHHV